MGKKIVYSGAAMKTTEKYVPQVSTRLTWKDRLDHLTARLGIRRYSYRVSPGLYAVGHPKGDSPVFVSANYG